MLIPIRSDRPLRSTPYVNYALIVVNVVIFIVTLTPMERAHLYFQREFERIYIDMLLGHDDAAPQSFNDTMTGLSELALTLDDDVVKEAQARAEVRTSDRFVAYRLMLHKHGTLAWQFLTYQFMHGGPIHLIGNMVFLWVFGNNVEDRLGKLGYLFFYLSAGVLAGLGHWLTSDAPVLGASGSVAGVTGAFLVLFPRTRIGFFYFLVIIGFFEVPAMIVVIFFFAKDVILYADGSGGVAYTAHIAGTLTGFALGMGLLLTRILPREPYDLLTMIEHRRRREKFRKITRQGFQPWEGKLGRDLSGPPAEVDPEVYEARKQIAQLAAEHDLPGAATRYAALLKTHPTQVLNQRLQTDIANQLANDGAFENSANAYELLLQTYPRHPEKPDLQLMLGLIYARYLDRPGDARPLLEAAAQRLDGESRDHAQQLLESLN